MSCERTSGATCGAGVVLMREGEGCLDGNRALGMRRVSEKYESTAGGGGVGSVPIGEAKLDPVLGTGCPAARGAPMEGKNEIGDSWEGPPGGASGTANYER